MSVLHNYHKIKINSNAWENHTLQFECPLDWNINQIKCYITHVYPRMQFNLFELTLGGRLIEPKQKLREILENRKSNQNLIFFIILRQSMKFEDYYAERMKKFEEAIQQQYSNIIECEQQNSLAYLPILNHKFQDFLKVQAGLKKLIQPPVPPNININAHALINEEQNNNGFGILNLLRMVLFYTILVLVYYHGTLFQAGVMLLSALVHYLVGNGGRRRPQNNLNINNNNVPGNNMNAQINNANTNNNEKKEENKQQKKGRRKVVRKENKLKKLAYWFFQAVICYLISFFPNWNVDDYIQKNKYIIQMYRAEIQQQVIFENDEPQVVIKQYLPEQIIENKQT